MERATFIRIINNFDDNETVVFATSAINANSSQIIAALKPTIDVSDDSFITINKSTKEKQLVYYIPYKNILMIMKG